MRQINVHIYIENVPLSCFQRNCSPGLSSPAFSGLDSIMQQSGRPQAPPKHPSPIHGIANGSPQNKDSRPRSTRLLDSSSSSRSEIVIQSPNYKPSVNNLEIKCQAAGTRCVLDNKTSTAGPIFPIFGDLSSNRPLSSKILGSLINAGAFFTHIPSCSG